MKKTFIAIAAAATALSFSSCQNPYGPGATNTQRDATTGALIGGIAGAVIGNQSGRSLEGAAVGAALGGAGGAAVGSTKDKQQNYYR
ncbi:Glycine zipper [Rubritalea squalenifaciens DSM 18772]|uniref:Glycine zipper n=1 Tax=Rubritalea squalenifaciens DSM 18772 TaxID=1123071 RepID=A0A1M6JHQ4_9BACT|nr:glycine zipper domain-containing protein [Rubritalea squalenifaciens]SHJ46258.1 Glycine zipper [Rubritalea squalenifaciens DSM 18772]